MTDNGHTGPPRVRLSSGFRCVSTTSSNSKVGICRKLAPCRSKPGNQDEAKNGGCTMGKAPNGGVLKWGGTPFIIHFKYFNRIFHYKSSIFLGSPMYGNHQMRSFWRSTQRGSLENILRPLDCAYGAVQGLQILRQSLEPSSALLTW